MYIYIYIYVYVLVVFGLVDSLSSMIALFLHFCFLLLSLFQPLPGGLARPAQPDRRCQGRRSVAGRAVLQHGRNSAGKLFEHHREWQHLALEKKGGDVPHLVGAGVYDRAPGRAARQAGGKERVRENALGNARQGKAMQRNAPDFDAICFVFPRLQSHLRPEFSLASTTLCWSAPRGRFLARTSRAFASRASGSRRLPTDRSTAAARMRAQKRSRRRTFGRSSCRWGSRLVTIASRGTRCPKRTRSRRGDVCVCVCDSRM